MILGQVLLLSWGPMGNSLVVFQTPLSIIIQDPPFPAKPLHNQGFHPHPDFLLITDHHWEANDVHIDLEWLQQIGSNIETKKYKKCVLGKYDKKVRIKSKIKLWLIQH